MAVQQNALKGRRAKVKAALPGTAKSHSASGKTKVALAVGSGAASSSKVVSSSVTSGRVVSKPGAAVKIMVLDIPKQIQTGISRGLRVGKAAATDFTEVRPDGSVYVIEAQTGS